MESSQVNQPNSSPPSDGAEEAEKNRVNEKREPLDAEGAPLSHYGRYKESHQKYAKSPQGKVARDKYAKSEKGKEARKRYQQKRQADLKLAHEAMKAGGVKLGDADPEELGEAIRLGKQVQAERDAKAATADASRAS